MRGLDSYLYQIELDLGAPLFESREQYTSYAENGAPIYPEIESPDELRDFGQVVKDLSKVDWSFTVEETGFLTHDLHPYPAKFIPQIPGHVISRLSLRGELVFDPFGGSGTTALEAVRLGRRALSTDANAIGTLIGKVKTCNLNRAAATDLHAIRCSLVARVADLPRQSARLCDEYANFIPEIPNIDKWFPLSSRGELALIRSRIEEMESEKARDIAWLAMSRTILAVSFQDSETRYSSKPREIPQGETIKRFLLSLDEVIRNVTRTQSVLRYGVCNFITADTRNLSDEICKPSSVDLIVTSPPYGNANDYHLYHRFRLLWLGHNPQKLAKVEIGSHLRHQKEATGFDSYISEMRDCLFIMHRVLRPGRYAVLVVGDAIYNKVLHNGAESLQKVAEEVGFETLCLIERQIHSTKRSFVVAGRRATSEKLLVLIKPAKKIKVWLQPPPYRLWPYELLLRRREIESVLGVTLAGKGDAYYTLTVDPYSATKARRLVFTHSQGQSMMDHHPSWQAIIENGFASQPSARKDPKYVTHGLHPYKGKFYPQLAKALINLCNLKPGSLILDPFCGSGTTLLEGYLNGYRTYGCDLHPLAAKIARSKLGILDINPDVLRETVGTLVKKIEHAPLPLPDEREQFKKECIEEIERWFPISIVRKLNWLLRSIRVVSDGVLRDFLEVVLSSIIRNISHQDPNDLRIRKRKILIDDADVFAMYLDALDTQYERIERFWSVKGYSPNRFLPSKIVEGDSRQWQAFREMRLVESSIDMILTSPPYATALPYIDTDRLSLLILFGLDSSKRRPLEQGLVGSREIIMGERKKFEDSIADNDFSKLPKTVGTFLSDLYGRVSKADVGFRRKNMPALLLRFLLDMKAIIQNCYKVMRPHSEAMIVIGDNRMRIKGDYERIPTTDFIQEIALQCGFDLVEHIDISVTTENLVHIKNAITENIVLRLIHP
ncbi:MAG: site-specific DNA-methyltransferase [Deltaproteobacteria bacterium]|nr:site-specific DNA-methyltransferase [Deltaproteobacteria bacterium]